ncbi:MAG: type II toxin-antitoxin system ParD family antitoxin [Gammaproteobacteria bacterium]|nr:type II toxin-antitoxin system ParD family antitoxin [Gammaproteobacteria bacterium]
MAKNTSVSLGPHFDTFISEKVKDGRYGSASEVVRAGLRLLESSETKLETLRALLNEGENSGFSDYSYDRLIHELDNGDP